MVKGFTMKLYEGQEVEYEKRHNLLWPEMKEMIHRYGGKNYTIFLDPNSLILFGYIEIEDEKLWREGAETEINKNGGIIWQTLWKQIPIIVLFV
jgi:YiiL_rotase: L-rhamnose 1-epimerase